MRKISRHKQARHTLRVFQQNFVHDNWRHLTDGSTMIGMQKPVLDGDQLAPYESPAPMNPALIDHITKK